MRRNMTALPSSTCPTYCRQNCRENFPGQKCGELTPDEQQAHFSLWAAFKSPLVIGADPRSLDAHSLSILTNKEVLDISQDVVAKPVRLIATQQLPKQIDTTSAGVKLKMQACNSDSSQQFKLVPAEHSSCCGNFDHNSSQCVSIQQSTPGTSAALCMTALAERWPWWVSLLPCDNEDKRQYWQADQRLGRIIANKEAVAVPWPSSAHLGKCNNGSCPVMDERIIVRVFTSQFCVRGVDTVVTDDRSKAAWKSKDQILK
eukprot:SAG31_NODE_680_length_12881_cov_35.655453_7_plen_259_part_00